MFNTRVEVKIQQVIRSLKDSFPLLLMFLRARKSMYPVSHIPDFQIFYEFMDKHEYNPSMIIHSYNRFKTIEIVNQAKSTAPPYQFKNNQACPFCNKQKYIQPLRFLLHLLISHSNRRSSLLYYTQTKELSIKYETMPQNQPTLKSKNLRHFSTMNDLQLKEHIFCQFYLNFVSNSSIQITNKEKKLKESTQQEDYIAKLLSQKTFYHGPSKSFRPIRNVQEFLQNSDDEKDTQFYIKNEMACLKASTPELQNTLDGKMMELYNANVLTLSKPLHTQQEIEQFQYDFLKNNFDLLKSTLKESYINHLFCMLTYGFIKHQTFVDLSTKIL